ncbi:hypothetical protein [Haliovirga abyssi]|uniref:Uncharacterized protein n=1 Tax=Haliovirga abyssi TaxID=2996794 RepID=A0AAU9DZA6_9FUSO|nr:hypothetical protein [Haliovirga abyssi]BDU50855.1 hypothetical protein HLVA_14240 [Haliovirga abyssi]
MEKELKEKLPRIIIFIILILLIPVLKPMIFGHSVKEIRTKMEQELKKDYGEDFIVENIGTRSANGEKFYQAEIYPKSIIGTNKEYDSYYHARASVDILPFGRLSGVAGTYGEIQMNDEAEEFLLPKAKKIFGEKIRMKVQVDYKKHEGDWFSKYFVSGFQEKMKAVKEDPKNKRLELTLYIYIFNKIDNEKEERRKEIYEYIQYLKKDGLFKYLEMGVIFIDERVLAPGYYDYTYEIKHGKKVALTVDGEKVYMPPMKLRKEMSKKLGEEVKKMSDDELIKRMNRISKSELNYYGISKYNAERYVSICSVEMLRAINNTKYSKEKKEKMLYKRKYIKLKDITYKKNLEYIYINKKGEDKNDKNN